MKRIVFKFTRVNVDGKHLRGVFKFLRFQIYPGQCGRGLTNVNVLLFIGLLFV